MIFAQNDRLSVHFYSVAFLGFMSVAGIPAFLEERQVFVRERLNGLYGPGAYVLANSVITLPYLFICTLLFTVLCYWSIGLNPGAEQFFRFLAILFLALYAAESQVRLSPPARARCRSLPNSALLLQPSSPYSSRPLRSRVS